VNIYIYSYVMPVQGTVKTIDPRCWRWLENWCLRTEACNKINCELMLTYDTPAYMFNVHKNQPSRQTGSRNLMGPKTIWGTYMKLVTKYQISSINSCWEKCDEKCAYMFNVYKNNLSRQAGSRNLTGQKTLPTILHTKIVTKYQISAISYELLRKMRRNKFGKQEVGIWRIQKRFPQYGIPIWSLWPNIRFLSSTVA
jgi:hypothetical protein